MSKSNEEKLLENSLDKLVYKVHHLLENSVATIYVFYGKKVPSKNQNEIFKKIFTNEEIENINKYKINVIFSDQQIHPDDTIGMVRIKILSELIKTDKISIHEIYLFCQKIEVLNSVSLYQTLTQNKK